MPQAISRRELLLGALAAPGGWKRLTPLGNSGLKLTRLGMGCEDVTDPALIRKAADSGINHFHALSKFEGVGEALRPIRKQVVLAAGSSEAAGRAMLDDLDRQLRAFGTDYIDLWYLTSKYRPEFITDDLLDAVRQARQAGKIRACAVAGHGLAAIVPRLLGAREVISATMVVCNFATWPRVEKLDPEARPRTALPGGNRADIIRLHEAGIGIIAMKPLMGGLRYVPDEHRGWADSLQQPRHRADALAAALKWVLGIRYVDSVPVRMSTIEQLEQNVAAAGQEFSDSDERLLSAALQQVSPYYCRMCQECAGSCRQRLPVSDLLRALMYADGYGQPGLGRALFQQLPSRSRAARCSSCNQCTVRCPYGVRVQERLSRAQAILS